MNKKIKKKYFLRLITVFTIIIMFIIVYPIFFYSYFSSFSLFTAQKDNILKSSLKYSILYKPSLNLYLNLKEFTPSNQNVNTINNFNPFLEIEDSITRNKLQEFIIIKKNNISQNKLQNGIISETNINQNSNNIILSSGKSNKRYYNVKKTPKSPKVYKILNLDKLDKKNLLIRQTEEIVQSTPVFYNGNIIFPTNRNSIISYNLSEDKINFIKKFPAPPARRGLVIENSGGTSSLYFNVGEFIVSINTETGKFNRNFGTSGFAKIGVGYTNPMINGDDIITSIVNPSSSVVSLNKFTGKINWKTDLRDISYNDGAAPWSGFTVHDSLVYVSTGNPRPALYGASRIGKNRYSNSVIALNVKNGKIIWDFQETSHGLWDFDISSTPLIHENKLIIPTKKGNLLTLDPLTGDFLGEYNMQRAPASDVPGEITSEYQINVTKPEPFLDLLDNDDIRVDLNLERYSFGFYEPPSLKKTTILFGLHGGSTWPGASINEATNQILLTSNRIPWKLRLYLQSNFLPKKKEYNETYNLYSNKCASCHGPKRNGNYETIGEKEINYVPSLVGTKYTSADYVMNSRENFLELHYFDISYEELNELKNYFEEIDKELLIKDKIYLRSLWSMFLDKNDLPITKPPYGEIVSYNLNTFDISWRTAIGSYSELEEDVDTGQMIHGGLVSTSNKIVYLTGTPDKHLRAYNVETGKLIWEYEMLNAGSSPPLIFHKNSRAYIAVMATGGKFFGYDKSPNLMYIFEI
tara:strand:- start:3630 stop:5879 length:2250 start_codon:yes stop_codon:yes gene_type:complete